LARRPPLPTASSARWRPAARCCVITRRTSMAWRRRRASRGRWRATAVSLPPPAAAAAAVCRPPSYCQPSVPAHAGKPSAVLKPDAVFFREPLPAGLEASLRSDAAGADLLIVIGSSLRVKPVSELPAMLPPGTPSLLINAEPIRGGGSGSGGRSAAAPRFDAELLGDADVIARFLWRRLGWPRLPPWPQSPVTAGGLGASATAEVVGVLPATTADGAASHHPFPNGGVQSAADGEADDDVTVTQEGPGRFLFASASAAAAQAAARVAMVRRMRQALAAVPEGSGGLGAEAATTRSGRAVKRPRR
jgi:hypothetical protein